MPVFLPLPEAAARLGVSQSALRRRLRAGTARGERRPSPGGFTWWVGVDEPTPTPEPTPGVSAPTPELATAQEAVRRLEAQVTGLTEELAARRREVAELHVTINRLVLALPPPAAATSTNGIAHDEADPAPTGTQNGAAPHGEAARVPGHRRWWQRVGDWLSGTPEPA